MKLIGKNSKRFIAAPASGRRGMSIFDEMIVERGGVPLVIPVEEFENLPIVVNDGPPGVGEH